MSDPVFILTATNPFGLSGFSELVDIDGDGDLDAFRSGNGGNTFFSRNTGTAENPVFATPQTNPFGLTNTGSGINYAFADIDNDGDEDAFVGQSAGNMLFFRNTGTSANPAFAASVINPFGLSNVGVSVDPTFVDIDGDGDMDAMIGEYDGGLYFFKNTGTSANPVFAAAVSNPFGLNGVYGNSSPTFVDIDGDGDLDAFIGSNHYTFGAATFFYRNIGTTSNPLFYRVSESAFGLSQIGTYPQPTFADMDNDGDQDAFIGNGNGAFYFENAGAGYTPSFDFGDTFGLGDVGYSPDPTFVDIDGDGDMDAFVGERDFYANEGGNTRFYENTGTAKNPAFAAAVTNPFGLTDVGSFSSSAFFDIDGDKDLDAFIGNSSGNTLFYRNTGTINNPSFAIAQTNPFGLKDAGNEALPTFTDIDKDGDLDAFIGNAAGNTLFFRNTGTKSNPIFAAPQTNPFGLNGSNPTFVDIDKDGDQDVFTGSTATRLYWNTGTASNPQFTDGGSAPFSLPTGFDRTRVTNQTFVDIDGDGDLDAYATFLFSYHFNGSYGGFYINNNTPNVSNLTSAEKYTKNTPLNLKDIVVIDPDSTTVTTTLKLSNAAAGGLSTGTSGTVTSTYNAATATWTASGAIANVNALLANVIFTPAANFTGAFTVNASVSDGTASPLIGSKSFTSGAGTFLTASAGNNILTGTASNNDTVTYATAGAAITVNLNITTQQNTGGSGLDTIKNVENLLGSAFNDNLTGNAANNVLAGNAGNDTLAGWSGADTMLGGPGDDTYLVENSGDIVLEKVNEGIDTVSSRLTYTLPANVENLTLTGISTVNGTGNSSNNIMIGNNAANQLLGGAGSDTIDGGRGANSMTGGTGNDFFKFTTTGHIDAITDYDVPNDTILLDNAVFAALGPAGTLPGAQFRIGANALDANDHIIYNSLTGALLYDANGSGVGAVQQIATLSGGLAMTNADFVVI
ncbi:MAG: hypothetical protein DYH15_01230 [Nitrosomonas sp. PRO4]|nr:hypothetical protein [Nitrosomonas sp. PRO4]